MIYVPELGGGIPQKQCWGQLLFLHLGETTTTVLATTTVTIMTMTTVTTTATTTAITTTTTTTDCVCCVVQRCHGYCRSRWKVLIFYALCVLSLGVLYLVTHWKPGWRILLTKSRCWLREADTLFLQVCSTCSCSYSCSCSCSCSSSRSSSRTSSRSSHCMLICSPVTLSLSLLYYYYCGSISGGSRCCCSSCSCSSSSSCCSSCCVSVG